MGKRVIRQGVFETNSSSTHSITIISPEKLKEWKDGKIFYCEDDEVFITAEVYKERLLTEIKNRGINIDNIEDVSEIDELLREKYEYYELTHIGIPFKAWSEDYDRTLESYVETYTTPKGEKIVIFGEYGRDS